ncbi:hypothetical protein AVEN_181557-1 [Araneus ventricosus]|uniref:Uncharacterized protein n=1 Tax=Araneus ventricosus TaxID=182803 RepID=A0A4Y2E3E3_ARAVE|nr:hypothetical protein AVEN_181557-1 [Araneus ventricosus]
MLLKRQVANLEGKISHFPQRALGRSCKSYEKDSSFVSASRKAPEALKMIDSVDSTDKSELDILDSVKNKNNTAMNCDEDEDDEDGNDHDAEINKPSHDEMLKSFEAIRRTV